MILSLGIGATTAAFSVIDAVLPRSPAYPSCSTTVSYAPALGDRMSDAYQASMDVAGGGLESWIDDAGGAADAARVLLLGAAALTLLIACSNGARSLHERSGQLLQLSGFARAAAATVGAVSVAAVLLRVMSSSSMADLLGTMSATRLDIRAIAFAACVSAAVEARRRIHPRLT
ncbi:MAG: hypothetical protein ACHQRL_03410 [Gemmatimonadales bacterium]